MNDNLIKSKLRAMNIYANLSKVKQPISLGAGLTNSSIPQCANSNKTKISNPNGGFEDSKTVLNQNPNRVHQLVH